MTDINVTKPYVYLWRVKRLHHVVDWSKGKANMLVLKLVEPFFLWMSLQQLLNGSYKLFPDINP